MAPGIQSIADLTTQTRITTGEIPPPLVGASTTVVGTRLILFAGRLVSSRKMTNDLYILDLDSFHWTRHIPPPDSDKPPKPRYFHSANAYKNQLVFFGGMGYSRASADGLSVLDDVSVLDLETLSWRHPEVVPSLYNPRPRYAHLSSMTGNRLVVVGGQDISNLYIEEINVLDMDEWTWVLSRPFEKHCGAYRSVAVCSTVASSIPLFGINQAHDIGGPLGSGLSSGGPPGSPGEPPLSASPLSNDEYLRRMPSNTATNGASGSQQRNVTSPTGQPTLRKSPSNGAIPHSPSVRGKRNSRDSIYRLSYSHQPSEENPNPIYLYSNYNFTDVRRELQLIFPPTQHNFKIDDHSASMSGNILPPGLRFPSGHVLGHHFILAGTYLTPQSQAFSLWCLSLANLVWTRVETGSIFSSGSWNRGVLHDSSNKFYVLGHRDRNLLEDYNHRQVNFDHVTIVDMEAFGVYQPPPATCAPLAQELGLSLLNDPGLADFEVLTGDRQNIPVNSAILAQRWPYFKELLKQSTETVEVMVRVPRKDGLGIESGEKIDEVEELGDITPAKVERKPAILSPRDHTLTFPEPFPVVIAFLQYIYTDHLLTAQQHQPHILAQLLLLSDMYDIPRLRDLTAHALHQMLNMSTAALIYETAALSNQTGLQIRALKVMIGAKKMMQQQQARSQSRMQSGGGQPPTPPLGPGSPGNPGDYSPGDGYFGNGNGGANFLDDPSPSPQGGMFGGNSFGMSNSSAAFDGGRMSLYDSNHHQSSFGPGVAARGRTASAGTLPPYSGPRTSSPFGVNGVNGGSYPLPPTPASPTMSTVSSASLSTSPPPSYQTRLGAALPYGRSASVSSTAGPSSASIAGPSTPTGSHSQENKKKNLSKADKDRQVQKLMDAYGMCARFNNFCVEIFMGQRKDVVQPIVGSSPVRCDLAYVRVH
ncbi:hypothetical protein BC938DRAFT_481979 [Jimgerdemannia flammicorona]|uniref:BTB domain-containing protein n=1 Tax=Jimgerdemannia flammicorona TaxID=994334 RepID=A0A433QEZ3_9FUNG|nr:hypothetical protein BC938DRAFT_481979 [Jimgerdemannia flammicorona]